MSRFLGRDSRRRRVLNEEALSASTAHLALRAAITDETTEDAPRYSEAAGVEHHPQVTDFVPRRFRTIGMLAAAGVASTALVETLHWFVTPLAATYGAENVAAFDLASRGVSAWISAVALLLAAANCVLIYSLRRHRVDDFKGRYRVWMGAAITCGLLSLLSVAPAHRLAAAALAEITGWTALRDNAMWWLLLAGLPCAWIAARAWLDARESRLAAVALAGAFLLCGVTIASHTGFATTETESTEAMITSGAKLLACWLLLVGTLSYGRYVVLDVQGLIPMRPTKAATSHSKRVEKEEQVKQAASHQAASRGPLHSFRAPNEDSDSDHASSTQWIDGSQGESEDYDEEDGNERIRKLTKADRKRLRQQKRAA